jgi:hypothetical protein
MRERPRQCFSGGLLNPRRELTEPFSDKPASLRTEKSPDVATICFVDGCGLRGARKLVKPTLAAAPSLTAEGDLGLASPALGKILTHSRGDFVHLRGQSPPNVNSRIDAQVAHRRSADVVFGVPTRISSWHHTSIGVPGASLARTSATRAQAVQWCAGLWPGQQPGQRPQGRLRHQPSCDCRSTHKDDE